MNINLHIERLVLDGLPLALGGGPFMQAAVQAELTRLLASGRLSDALTSGGTWYNVKTVGIHLGSHGSPSQLGGQIAGAVYEGIGK